MVSQYLKQFVAIFFQALSKQLAGIPGKVLLQTPVGKFKQSLVVNGGELACFWIPGEVEEDEWEETEQDIRQDPETLRITEHHKTVHVQLDPTL